MLHPLTFFSPTHTYIYISAPTDLHHHRMKHTLGLTQTIVMSSSGYNPCSRNRPPPPPPPIAAPIPPPIQPALRPRLVLNLRPGPSSTIFLGPERQASHVSIGLITAVSPFFSTAFRDGARELNLPEDEPKVFSQFVQWMIRGREALEVVDYDTEVSRAEDSDDEGDSDSDWDDDEDVNGDSREATGMILHLYVFATKYLIPRLQQDCLNTLHLIITLPYNPNPSSTSSSHLLPDSSAVTALFTGVPDTHVNPMCRLVIDLLQYFAPPNYLKEMVFMSSLWTQMRHRQKGYEKVKNVYRVNICRFHKCGEEGMKCVRVAGDAVNDSDVDMGSESETEEGEE